MLTCMQNLDTLGKQWAAVYGEGDKKKRQALLKEILDPFEAIVDFPGCYLVDDLLELYPDAKVVLGLRNSPEQWRRSITNTLDRLWTPSEYIW
jgi:hypothetical protein